MLNAAKKVLQFFNIVPTPSNVRDTLEELIEEESNPLDEDNHERTLLRNVLGLRDITAWDVMVPRADIAAVDVKTSITELVSEMVKLAHSRLPVYRNNLDEILGMVHIKDVLAHSNSATKTALSDLIREVLFVSPTIRALDLLQEMRMTRRHLALVVDEFGGIDGLITIEDLVEEIVGEIIDEHDEDEDQLWIEEKPNLFLVNARLELDMFRSQSGVNLRYNTSQTEEYETIGGLVNSLTNRIPARGEVIKDIFGNEFSIVEADARRIKRLRLQLSKKFKRENVEKK